MSLAKFYANENFPLPVVVELRRLGHDVLTVQDSGKADSLLPDREVLAFATSDDRCVLTINRRHFIRLHGESSVHSGILVCTLDLDFIGQARRIHESVTDQPRLSGQLLRVNRPSA